MKTISFLLFAVIFLCSCQKEQIELSRLNFSSTELEYQIAINGFISTEKSLCKVNLSKPIAINETIKFNPIHDAIVTLKEESNIYFFEFVGEEGAYFSRDSIQAVPGAKYTLEVKYKGKLYSASGVVQLQSMNDIKIPIRSSILYDDEGDILPPDKEWIEFSVPQHNFGFDQQTIMFVNENTDAEGNILSYGLNWPYWFRIYNHKGSLPQGVFSSGFTATGLSGFPTDSLEIINLAISDSYYEYLISILNETDWKTGVFSAISGNVKTNVSEGGIGYFYTINSKRIKLTYKALAGLEYENRKIISP